MKARNYTTFVWFIGLVLSASVVSACGSSQDGGISQAPAYPASPEFQELSVGAGFGDGRANTINFAPVVKGRQTKTLTFTAPFDGRLMFPASDPRVMGSRCGNVDPHEMFSPADMSGFQTTYDVLVKDPRTGRFSRRDGQPREGGFHRGGSIALSAGAEIQVRFELDSEYACESATVTGFNTYFEKLSRDEEHARR
jgi:hypothetical protein